MRKPVALRDIRPDRTRVYLRCLLLLDHVTVVGRLQAIARAPMSVEIAPAAKGDLLIQA